jgi:ABC-type glucose/galactose transport system permease subunit
MRTVRCTVPLLIVVGIILATGAKLSSGRHAVVAFTALGTLISELILCGVFHLDYLPHLDPLPLVVGLFR